MKIPPLLAAYADGSSTPRAVIRALLPHLDNDPAIWISRFADRELLARAEELERLPPPGLPLYGIPFAVKDNIDVAGLPTTAACPDFSHIPGEHAPVVRLLIEAGAICIGKTNLDQFATGLVGVRSPYGVPKNPYGRGFIPGGSSAGSAVAVAAGLVAFSLGTDTAGSGRVPAAFNNLFGWKPTRGLLSTRGVVPACRSLDCVSVFANSADDLQSVLRVVSVFDKADPFARDAPLLPCRTVRRVGIPRSDHLEFFGDAGYAALWEEAVGRIRERGLAVDEVDFGPFLEAARLLYEGPWVAERYLATKELLDRNPEALHPVTRQVIENGRLGSAADAFAAQYRLADLRRRSEEVWESVDVLCTPTAGTIRKISEVEADPVRLNSQLGHYTNFMNLLDLSGLAVPAGFRPDGLPFGITYIARAFEDSTLLALAGAAPDPSGTMEIAVCGAHMSGLPLNHQLISRRAEFARATKTAPVYRMFALDENRPGLVRVPDGGASLELEVWRVPSAEAGPFLAAIPSPLGLGRILLEDGTAVCGFLCEQIATTGKQDISSHGGWRAWLGVRERD
ncbi:MAG: allophanate hydrolase [Terrimicrobiaceae bacterium]